MEKINIEPFKVIGISMTTSNERVQKTQDIAKLWGHFIAEKISEKIPNKIDNSILSIYTHYESDHQGIYDTILGCRVSTLNVVPDGMVGESFGGGAYMRFVSKGDFTKGAVYNTWTEIWNSPLHRIYSADFEVYGEKSKDPTSAEIDIFVAVGI
ncbi:GyrI-like domain-containing protein [Kriegella aquimaris]|uniref:Predicted transcriptional regulator YdeE, contains AraC-type DNA-binding domain n=1 Tax=Kriegella aquimaris TaxID=192904 RepID=A0A1G9X887_9FLAO|nr:GyrI-like domain-containing protein [Kriegella aquimaris]SDM92992.1 Predicted transcriptional regulator YdeE, contains AraC-type DNA-binding domain [Kriegella aquimaris]